VDSEPVVAKRPARVDEAEQLLQQLRRMCEEGAVKIELDEKRLRHIDSPVVCEPDSTRWIYGALVVGGVVWWFAGMTYGIIALAVGAVLYATVGRSHVRRRLDKRVREIALRDTTVWRKLWRFGGVTLVRADGNEPARCAAPQQNWMTFVQPQLAVAPSPAMAAEGGQEAAAAR